MPTTQQPTTQQPATSATPPTTSPTIPPSRAYPVPFSHWEVLAYDLAIDIAPIEIVAERYGVTLEELETLKQDEHFGKLLQDKQAEVAAIGANASYVTKLRTIVNKATPRMLSILLDPDTPAKDFINLYKTASEYAGLVPKETITTEPALPQQVGASIVFNIQGVPGLEHLSTPPAPVIDAEYTEHTEYTESSATASLGASLEAISIPDYGTTGGVVESGLELVEL